MAAAAAGSIAGSLSSSVAEADGQGTGVGIGKGGAGTGIAGGGFGAGGSSNGTGGSSGGNQLTSKSGDTTALGFSFNQAATALSAAGICGKGSKFGFGAVEWSDYSSKCFDYHMAMQAQQAGLQAAIAGNPDLADKLFTSANEWVARADQE
jgi:hypothetical protein